MKPSHWARIQRDEKNVGWCLFHATDDPDVGQTSTGTIVIGRLGVSAVSGRRDEYASCPRLDVLRRAGRLGVAGRDDVVREVGSALSCARPKLKHLVAGTDDVVVEDLGRLAERISRCVVTG